MIPLFSAPFLQLILSNRPFSCIYLQHSFSLYSSSCSLRSPSDPACLPCAASRVGGGWDHLLECCLCASPCWTWGRVGTKHNESLRNITWHPQTKTKDYGTTTKIQTRTQIMNAPTTPVTTGQGFWSWSRRATTSH